MTIRIDRSMGLAGLRVAMRAIEFDRAKKQDVWKRIKKARRIEEKRRMR